jgi:very-short-patch-repair endonuclease
MAGGIEKLSAQLAEVVSYNAQMGYAMWDKAITSPIERVFAVGLYSLIALEEAEFFIFTDAFLCDGQNPPPYFKHRSSINGAVVIEYQKRELDWLADFVISVPTYTDKKIIVECDGHDFHERTKEQAMRDRARDRAAQAAGYQMMRFTGAEIFRDPLKCVRETLTELKKLSEAAR